MLTLEPNSFHKVGLTLKNTKISLLPETPNEETRDELPDSIEDRILKGVVMPIFNGVRDAIRTMICSFTSIGYVGRELISKRTLIEDMLHGFFIFFAKRTL